MVKDRNKAAIDFIRTPAHLKVLFVLLASFVLFAIPLNAQFYNGSNMSFGKNRVQWDNTIWTYYRFNDFDTYFYLNGQELALYASNYAIDQIPQLERKLQSSLSEKIQFIVFNSLSDLKQSNIGLASEQQYNTGGITQILGTKVILYFDGNYLNFEQQIRAGLTEMLLNQLMFGGSIGSQIRNTAVFNLPDWYKNGILSYVSEDWNTTLDDRLREGIVSGRYKKLNRLTGDDARVAGNSLWRYITEIYGPSALPDILHMTQMNRNVQQGFLYVTGIRFKNLVKDWFSHYQKLYEQTAQRLPDDALPMKYRTYRKFEQPALSPDGRFLAYVTHDEGKIRFWLRDLNTGKKRKLYKTGYRSDDKPDDSYPLLSWHPGSELLAFVTESKGKLWLHFYHTEERTLDSRNMINYQKITSISYASDGRKLAMAAVQQGKPDIYVFNIPSNTHEQITNDFDTDLNPVFADADKRIVFSSNRLSDTLNREEEAKPGQNNQLRLFAYDYARKSDVLQPISNSENANEINPSDGGKGLIRFLSDQNGVFNLYEARFDSVISFIDTTVHYRYFTQTKMLTDFTRNIHDYSWNPISQKLIVLMRDNNRQKFFEVQQSDLLTGDFDAVSLTRYARKRQALSQQKNETENADSLAKPSRRFKTLYREVTNADSLNRRSLPQRQGAFGILGNQRTNLRLDHNLAALYEDTLKKIPKRRNYYVEYFYDELVTQVDFTYINYSYQPFSGGGSPIYLNPGFNVYLGVNLTDLLEDYRISGGVRLNTSLINNEYAASFSNLRKRMDKHIVVHRQSVEDFQNTFISRTYSHEAFYMLSWPFSEVLSVRGTAIYRNDMKVFLATDQLNLKKNNSYENWGGLRTELVYDNSKQIGMNLHTGMRAKVFGEYYQLIDSDSRNFVVLGFDWRHYQRIHRNFIWANRIAGSSSFGTDRLIYYMGGVDNWLFPSFNRETPIDFGQNYTYQTLATNMRGFNQNIRNGNSFVVINTELRFPVFSYLFQNPISSDFIRNFQLITFGDIGTAWTGWNPYDPANSLYTSYIENGPLTISVEIQKDPWVGGMGLGARTTLLGYFIRADVAWGVEDGEINKPVFYLSLSLDF
ncbi:MAG: hypothetical protein KJ578_05010 [Bacteroidetes bacterium]|nr:hypothetical protein [Bacteroidota bacterium]MBU1580274.1 hypothetical protein [Bacteroidota bacterium]MBU2557123.1 hypothetical protein [Bacteroidota bacterium]